jgi:hypothetical protein
MKQIYPSPHKFSRYVLFVSLAGLLSFSSDLVVGQTCPASATTTIISYPNTYYPGTSATLSVGASSITIGAAILGTDAIATGDVVLVIQMQGAQINTSNNNNYGGGAGTGNGYTTTSLMAGNMEYVVANNNLTTAGGILTLKSGLVNSYQNSAYTATSGQYRYQIVRVPVYHTLQLNATITVPSWNGTSGGVLVLWAYDSLIMNGQTISAAGAGFRGGGGRKLSGAGGTSASSTDYRTNTTFVCNGSKGEGIAGTPRFLNNNGVLLDAGSAVEGYPNGSYARGAPGNAGGGGTDGDPNPSNDQNTGGGGGANGGPGGGGGNSWSTNIATGGKPGAVFSQNSPSSLVLGGGGGAGTSNDGTGSPSNGLASSGAPGGGIVIVMATTISGTGTIDVSGGFGNSTVQNDGAGGGGAGGSAMIFASTGNLTNLKVNANGGNGGSNETGGGASHGPGGAGGGGVIYSNSALSAASTANGGISGSTSGNTTNYGAGNGTSGSSTQNINQSQVPAFPVICMVLSMNFVSITAESQNGSVAVDWAVANEVNSVASYIVEKSFDGANYTAIGTVHYTPATTVVNRYHFTDDNGISPTGTIYYRIQEVELTGATNYSWIVTVRADAPTHALTVYPNPANQTATISFASTVQGTISLKLVDIKGSLLWKTEYQANAGVNTLQVSSVGNLPDGIYFLQYFDGSKPGTVKLLVKH